MNLSHSSATMFRFILVKYLHLYRRFTFFVDVFRFVPVRREVCEVLKVINRQFKILFQNTFKISSKAFLFESFFRPKSFLICLKAYSDQSLFCLKLICFQIFFYFDYFSVRKLFQFQSFFTFKAFSENLFIFFKNLFIFLNIVFCSNHWLSFFHLHVSKLAHDIILN